MSYPCRCNRRECQARRNLRKHPEQYAKWPTCHKCGAGRMYVDTYRLKKGAKDNAPVCRDTMCPAGVGRDKNGSERRFPHKVSTRGCNGYGDYVTKRNTAPRSKHSPIPPDEWVPF